MEEEEREVGTPFINCCGKYFVNAKIGIWKETQFDWLVAKIFVP